MKRIIFLISLIFTALLLIAATFISVINGDWSASQTWDVSSSPPISTSDNITIATNVTTNSNIIIKAGGFLTVNSNDTLTVNDMQFNNGSNVIIEDLGVLIINGNLTNKNNSDAIEIYGSVQVSGSFDNGNGGIVTGTGSIQVDGSYTGVGVTFGLTNSDIPAGTTISGEPMPVELISFTYEITNNEVTLFWVTASETNNDYFTIERSEENINFIEIGTILGAGNSNNVLNYKFTDTEPIKDISYYRLKQTDYNGAFEYSDILACDFDYNETTYIEIYTLSGQLVCTLKNTDLFNNKLSSGVYIVNSNNKTYKIFIQ
jgi:hypothetical protein